MRAPSCALSSARALRVFAAPQVGSHNCIAVCLSVGWPLPGQWSKGPDAQARRRPTNGPNQRLADIRAAARLRISPLGPRRRGEERQAQRSERSKHCARTVRSTYGTSYLQCSYASLAAAVIRPTSQTEASPSSSTRARQPGSHTKCYVQYRRACRRDKLCDPAWQMQTGTTKPRDELQYRPSFCIGRDDLR